MELPEEPPQLTPDTALALLRILLKAHTERLNRQTGQPVTDHLARPADNPERKG